MSPPDAQGAPAGEITDPQLEKAYPKELQRRESTLIAKRRGDVGVPASEGRVGFGLSGGGIRSATFCLGLFRGLARQGKLLKRIDFLSTVSGGGYFGGFYGRLMGRDYIEGPGDVEAILQGKLRPEVLRNLRENGRYISPNGAGDMLLAGAVLLRNWVSIQLVLLVFLLSGFLALQALRGVQGLPALAGRFGGCELVRRRLPLIVLVDAEQDADYGFEALANLVRKARLDFGAEIRFLTEEDLDREVDSAVRHAFGTLEALRRGERAGLSRAHAALARISYGEDEPESRLLLIKPTLTGDEPQDLLQYHAAHPDFPQESTAHQFFDEAQWESYRKLGEHVAKKLFAAPTEGSARWCPRLLGRAAVL